MTEKWIKTLLTPPDAAKPGASYEKEVYRRNDASLGMPDIELYAEDEWSFDEEAYGRKPVQAVGLQVRHEEGIALARDARLDLSRCFVCPVEIVQPVIAPENVAFLTKIFPGEQWYNGRRLWHLGFDEYEYLDEVGAYRITLFLTSRRLEESTYAGPGASRPPVKLRLHQYQLAVIDTPDWIQHGCAQGT